VEPVLVSRAGNFLQKNYSAEDGIEGTIGLCRRNSGCSAEKETFGIPAVARNRKLLEFRSKTPRRGKKCLEFSIVEQN
jgi:hypothetical protein